jgi:hypothetical protein
VEAAWDEAKNNANQKKHGISFEEAGVLFTSGVDYLEIFDEFHSHMEDRFLAIGPYTEVFEDAVRIISARPATSRERSMYQGHLKEHQR